MWTAKGGKRTDSSMQDAKNANMVNSNIPQAKKASPTMKGKHKQLATVLQALHGGSFNG
jgi:hypothetical protein